MKEKLVYIDYILEKLEELDSRLAGLEEYVYGRERLDVPPEDGGD